MMLEARQSFTYTDPFDGRRKAVHRGSTRVSSDHELAKRYPMRFGSLPDSEPWALRHADDGGTYRMADGRSITDAMVVTRAVQESHRDH
jgi:hypothetical protein